MPTSFRSCPRGSSSLSSGAVVFAAYVLFCVLLIGKTGARKGRGGEIESAFLSRKSAHSRGFRGFRRVQIRPKAGALPGCATPRPDQRKALHYGRFSAELPKSAVCVQVAACSVSLTVPLFVLPRRDRGRGRSVAGPERSTSSHDGDVWAPRSTTRSHRPSSASDG